MLDEETNQLVAVLDAQRATTLQVTRKVNYIKQLAALLNQVHLHAASPLLKPSHPVSSLT